MLLQLALVLILALDSSRKQQSIALFDGKSMLASISQEIRHPAKRSFASDVDTRKVGTVRSTSSANEDKMDFCKKSNNSSQLLPVLVKLFENTKFKPQELSLLACSIGPGSFTGLRTTLTVVKTMAAQLDLPIFAINNFELLRFEHGLRADEALAMAAGKNDYFISLDSNYDNQETNFFSLEIGLAQLFDFKASSAELIINYMQQYPNFKTLSYQELEPYYLREPSISKAKL